jgi:siroheme synthase-like protein
MTGRRVVLIGAGAVAWQKIPLLLECEATVIVIAPEALPEIQELAKAGRITWHPRPYQTSDIEHAYLVISSTNDSDLQKRIAADCRERRIWVNVVDVTPLCDFIAPAVVAQGDVQIAISTGGSSPALASFLRKKLQPLLGEEYAVLTAALQRWRPQILQLPKDRRKAVWEAIINQDFIDQVKAQGPQVIENRLTQLLNEHSV